MHLSGTEANNTFTLTVAGGVITGTSTGFGSFTRTTAGVNAIIINGRGGSDTFNIDSTTIPVSAGGDAGNDTFNLGNGDIDNNLNSNVSVFGEAGTDTVFFDDTIDDNSVDDTYTLTTNTLTKSSEAVNVHLQHDGERDAYRGLGGQRHHNRWLPPHRQRNRQRQ